MNKRFLLLDELVDVVVAEILSIDEMYIVCTQACCMGGGRGGSCPPDFGRSEGAAGQGQRAALLPTPPDF